MRLALRVGPNTRARIASLVTATGLADEGVAVSVGDAQVVGDTAA